MKNKFELVLNEPVRYEGTKLYRIRALRDIYLETGIVKAGELGGLVEKEACLSQNGNCWVTKDAIVLDTCKIHDDAIVDGETRLKNNIFMYGNSYINIDPTSHLRHICMYNETKIVGRPLIWESTFKGECVINGDVCVAKSVLDGRFKITGYSKIEYSNLKGELIMQDQARMNNCKGSVYLEMSENASISESTFKSNKLDFDEHYIKLKGNFSARNCKNVSSTRDFVVMESTWGSNRSFTYYIPGKKYTIGCFCGTEKQLLNKLERERDPIKEEYYKAAIKYAKAVSKIRLEKDIRRCK